jgi:hypothetical protein
MHCVARQNKLETHKEKDEVNFLAPEFLFHEWTHTHPKMAKGQMEERAQVPGGSVRSFERRLRRSLSTVAERAFPVRAGPLPPLPPGVPLYICVYTR